MTESSQIKAMYGRLDSLLERVKIEAFSKGKDSAFFASLACSAKVNWTEDINGIANDGVNIYISPKFFLSLTTEQRIRAYMDQLWHIGLLHNFRGENKDPEIWQQACNIVVDTNLNESGYVQMPQYEEPSHLDMFSNLVTTKNESEESIYNQILKLVEQNGGNGTGEGGSSEGNDNQQQSSSGGSGQGDNNDSDSNDSQDQENNKSNGNSKNPMNNDLMPSPDPNLKDDRDKSDGNDKGNGNGKGQGDGEDQQSKKSSAQMKQELQAQAVSNVNGATQSAMMMGASGKEAGSITGQAKLIIDKFLKPKVDWKKQLNKWFRDFSNTKTSFRRRNRRYTSIYMPRKHRDDSRLQLLNYYIDISGSISNEQIKRFNSEIRHVFNTLKPKQVNIIPFDTSLDKITVFKEGDTFEYVELTGRGGTCLEPVREHILETKPNGAVIFSDLYCRPMDAFDENIPLLWVVVDRDDERNIDVFKGDILLLDTIPD